MNHPVRPPFSRARSRRSVLLLTLANAAACAAPSRSERVFALPQDKPAEAAPAVSDAEAAAKKLANPIAALISVPFQFNSDRGLGPTDDGERYYLNVQPVIPISLNEDWNVISRTILPIQYLDDVVPGEDEFGLGDVLQSLFFSPKEPTSGGLIWGVGPVASIPTATDDALGTEKIGLGPTLVLLKQEGPWTYGALANHIWSIGGDADHPYINQTFVQPFLAYTTKDALTYTANSESTFDWRTDEWAVPVNLLVSRVTKVGDQLLSIGGGVRYWIDAPDGGPEGLGARLFVTLLF